MAGVEMTEEFCKFIIIIDLSISVEMTEPAFKGFLLVPHYALLVT
jgi:hypothetical protein